MRSWGLTLLVVGAAVWGLSSGASAEGGAAAAGAVAADGGSAASGAPSGHGHGAARPDAGAAVRGHRFEDAETWAARFERPERAKWQKPEALLDLLQIAPDARVADIGSATGYFPVRVAKRVPQGRVWGVDIEPDMVRYLNARAREGGLTNLFSILGLPDDPLLPEPVDLVMSVNTFHHISHRTAYFRHLRDHLRPGARLAIVDWKPGKLAMGPPEDLKVPPFQAEAELREAGYRKVKLDEETLPYQYLLVVEPTG